MCRPARWTPHRLAVDAPPALCLMSISALTTLALVARRSSRPTASRSSLARSRKRFLAVKAGALAVDIYAVGG